MDKDAYYFPHFSNARNDRKIKRLRKELGMEGYGIYFGILEVLRDQPDFKYPIQDIDLLADDLRTSEEKVKTVINRYKLFEISDDEFFSPKFNEYLKPYLQRKESKRIAGIKGNLIKHNHFTKQELQGKSPEQIIALNDAILADSRSAIPERSQKLANESKVKERKGKKIKLNTASDSVNVPDWEEFWIYAEHKAYYEKYAKHLYDSLLSRGWRNKNNQIVTSWKSYLNMMHKFQRQWITNNANQNGEVRAAAGAYEIIPD